MDFLRLTEFAEPANQNPQGHQVLYADVIPLPGHNRQCSDGRHSMTTFSSCVRAWGRPSFCLCISGFCFFTSQAQASTHHQQHAEKKCKSPKSCHYWIKYLKTLIKLLFRLLMKMLESASDCSSKSHFLFLRLLLLTQISVTLFTYVSISSSDQSMVSTFCSLLCQGYSFYSRWSSAHYDAGLSPPTFVPRPASLVTLLSEFYECLY